MFSALCLVLNWNDKANVANLNMTHRVPERCTVTEAAILDHQDIFPKCSLGKYTSLV